MENIQKFLDKNKTKINSLFDSKKKKKSNTPPPPPETPENKSHDKVKKFVKFVLMLLIGYKLYYFNLNLEYFFSKIDYNKSKTIFLTGGSINKISKETFESMFGKDINRTLTENLKNEYDDSWFSKYVFNLKLDYSYYFLKLMTVINKFKLTRYFVVSLFIGGLLYSGIMFIMGLITSFFSIYGLLRVFNTELPFYIFAAFVPFFLMPIISSLAIFYYTFKLLFLETKLPDNTEKPNINGVEMDKLVILSFIITYISTRIPNTKKGFKITKKILIFLSLLMPCYYTWTSDFFLLKDKDIIWDYIKENAENVVYLIFFIICIILFSKYS